MARVSFPFFSLEGNPREPVHIHVARRGAEAKFWLHPKVRLVRSDGMTPIELRRLEKVIEEHRQKISEARNDFFA